MQTVVKNTEIYMLINTLPVDIQDCLISTTVSIDKEEAIINKYLKENRGIRIIVFECRSTLRTKTWQIGDSFQYARLHLSKPIFDF